MADVAQKECLVQHNWGTVPTGSKLQRMACSTAAKDNGQVLLWLSNSKVKSNSINGKTKVSQK
jgi:hypothetical protein